MSPKTLIPSTLTLFLIFLLTACSPPEENNIPEQVFTTYETATYKIQLTENYIGADPKTPGLNVVINWMTANGFDAQGFSSFMQAKASEILYVGINTELSVSNLLSYFTLTGGAKPEGFSVDEFEQNYNKTVGTENFLSREQKELGENPIEILHYKFSQDDTIYLSSFYFLETATQIWKFEFVAPKTDHDDKIAEFEQIVAQFQPRPGQ
ncbi:MAG: hypothetical protein HUU38_15675 [Anaerolineales bacterium]|nr:hypothetical protein [Anaerolineales bacterium]